MVSDPRLGDWLSGLTQLTLRQKRDTPGAGHRTLLATMLPRLTALQSLTLIDDAIPRMSPGGRSTSPPRPSKLHPPADVVLVTSGCGRMQLPT